MNRAGLHEGGGADTELANSATSREEGGADGLYGETQVVGKSPETLTYR